MSTGNRCTHSLDWAVVTMRRANQSAFNGWRLTPSDYSAIRCTFPGCVGSWRTKAGYVATLSDGIQVDYYPYWVHPSPPEVMP